MNRPTRRATASPARRNRIPRHRHRPDVAAGSAPAGPISMTGSLVHGYGFPLTFLDVPAGTTGNARVLMFRNFTDAATITAVSGGGPPSSGTGLWTRIGGGTADGSGSVREIWLGRISSGSTRITVTYSATPSVLTELMTLQLASVSGTSAVWARVGSQAAILDTASTTAPPFPSLTATATGQCYVGHMAFWGSGRKGTTPGFVWFAAPNNNQVAVNVNVTAGVVAPSAIQSSAAASYAIGALVTDGT
jgi:hypothetical protein